MHVSFWSVLNQISRLFIGVLITKNECRNLLKLTLNFVSSFQNSEWLWLIFKLVTDVMVIAAIASAPSLICCPKSSSNSPPTFPKCIGMVRAQPTGSKDSLSGIIRARVMFWTEATIKFESWLNSHEDHREDYRWPNKTGCTYRWLAVRLCHRKRHYRCNICGEATAWEMPSSEQADLYGLPWPIEDV